MPPKGAEYSPELRELAVRMVAERRTKYKSDQEAILAVADALRIRPETLRKWVHQSERGGSQKGTSSSRFDFVKKSVFRAHPIMTGVAIAVLGGLGLTYSEMFLGTSDHAPHLEVDGVSLTSPKWAQLPNGLPAIRPFKIDIKLLNTGTQLAVINNARLVIQKFAAVPLCLSQGSFASTGRYRGNMPTDPRPGSVVNIRVSQLVKPDGADRFDLLLRTPNAGLAADMKAGLAADAVYLYQVRLYLDYNTGGNVIDVGQIIVDLPWEPTYQAGYFWARLFKPGQFNYMGSSTPGINRCLIRNSRTLKAILSLPGQRTSVLASIPSELSVTRL